MRKRPITAEARAIICRDRSKELATVLQAFQKWLQLPEPGVVTTALGAVAANLMDGDPVWLLLIGPPASGKTEILDSLLGLSNMHPAGTLTEAALLSGVPKKEHAKDASGGLLRALGSFGLIVAKDFTSVLSMARDNRTALFSALREIHDGAWTRHVGTDGGRELSWAGKCAFLGGCTPTIDQHHAVMASMGERFLMRRMPDCDAEQQARQALKHIGREGIMRRELRDAVSRLFADFEPRKFHLDEAAETRLAALASLVAKCRSSVERDGYRREIDLIPGSERPARLVQALARMYQAMVSIGASDAESWKLTNALALDCMPDIRRRAFNYLRDGERVSTTTLSVAIEYPTTTTRRALEDLNAHGILTRHDMGEGKANEWQMSNLCNELWRRAQPFPKCSQGNTGTVSEK